MPEVVRVGKYIVVIYPNDHAPAHVRVHFTGCEVRVLITEAGVVRDEIDGKPKAQEIRRALESSPRTSPPASRNGRKFMEKSKPRIIIPPAAELAEIQRRADHEHAHRYAREMTYSPRRREFRFVLRSGVTIAIPVAVIGYGFEKLTPAQLGRVRLDDVGHGIGLRELNMDLSVPGIIRYALGFGELQQHRAGRVRTPKKAASSRANGLKGGRPRKAPAAV